MWTERHEVSLPQGAIEYRDVGAGPPVVFVHGLLVDADLWSGVAERLAPHARCLAPELPLGSHRLPLPAAAADGLRGLARLIADFLEALDLRDVTLVGNDSGGLISQLVIARHPERIGRLVLTNCDSYERVPPALAKPFVWAARRPSVLRTFLRTQRARPGARVLAWAVARTLDRALFRRWLSPAIEDPAVLTDVATVLRSLDGNEGTEAARAFASFIRPVLLVWGTDDKLLFPRRDAERLQADFSDSRLELVERAKAFVPLDRPDAVAEHIAAFLPATATG